MTDHTITFRVYYEDTDAGGVVYHANYLKFAERARTEWLRTFGFEQSKLMEECEIFFPVYHLEINFNAPAQLDDLLTIHTRLLEFKKASMKMEQLITCNTREMASLVVSVACVNLDKKLTAWPQQLQKALAVAYLTDDLFSAN